MTVSHKTFLSLGLVGLSAVLLSGCSLPGQSTNQNGVTSQSQNQNQERQMAQILQAGEPVYCVMTKPGTEERIEYWVKNKKMKMMGTGISTADDSERTMGNMISDGEYIYVWGEGQSSGMKLRVPSEEEIKESQAQYQEYLNKLPSADENYESNLEAQYQNEGYGVNCQPQNINDDEFVAPSNISFTDMATMMQAAPSTPVMNAEDQAAFEQMMKQYQNQGE